MKNKKSLSTVVSIVIMIAIAVALIAVVLVVVRNMLQDTMNETGSCYGTYGEVKINKIATCKNITNKELKFSLELGDLEVDEILVSISDSSKSKSFEITNENKNINNIKNSTNGDNIILPEKKASSFYYFNYDGELETPKSIKIAPRINGNLCDTSDTLFEIGNCI